ncbi:hypothetical protein CAPTEDRAFT_113465 [Capitella teleta]|uniref:Uncharacterized protein n=1 Tax=Capitella teleta TaxID=283909 RepID=R7UTY4_CAPTE|nr:hypothetical protein CAPTEDRAFT_113465 [Capitella teleta]|eukprot:ELU07397.1 hypothetical protein CAPTEDRAFT_113465 [Capitella teleta]
MATVVSFLLCYRLVLGILPSTEASTHWMVTEDGRIQTQMDSIYNLKRPYDLMAMMKQEQQSEKLKLLKQELLVKKQQIDRNEDRDTGLEDRFYREDPDCIAAGKPLLEFDLLISTVLPLENKGIRPEEHIDFNSKVPDLPREPECSDMVDLDYSIHAFEHLEGLKARSNLSGSPELGLKNAITHRDSVEDYGHLVHEAMHKNKTSWVLYNMAAFYWRIKGQPTKAVECLRRALHYSPRLHKDVALISLANLLHRARYSNEAAIIVHAALDVSQELNVNHFTLGNIYAVLAEYNKSIICFENTLKIQPDFQAAAKRKHAVKCHAKLEASLEAQHRSLQRTLTELREYQESHEFFRLQQERLMLEQASVETRLEQNKAYESLQQKRIEAGLSKRS